MKNFYLTTPIYYVNAEPHLGHAYTTILADTMARFRRLEGRITRFQTGTDEHGDKIAQAAKKQGVSPRHYADRISALFRAAWPRLNIQPDSFIRTTDERHMRLVQKIMQQLYDKGDIYFSRYGGNYCVGCERFYQERELVEGKCPDHQTVPVYIEEENYFFKMSQYQQALISHIESNPTFIRPERYRNEVLSFLKEPLEDLCISRPKNRLAWGIELPFDQRFVTYVWFDALMNYLTGLDWPDGEDYHTFWAGEEADAQHLIAKDILKPHAIYWPAMLMAAGIPLYSHLNVHGYWKINDGKMSKSLGNVVKPMDLAHIYGVDPFRYFLLREMAFGLDASFSEELLVERYNADLANDLGNLFSRVLNMLCQYRQGVVPARPQDAVGRELAAGRKAVLAAYREHMDGYEFHLALAALGSFVSDCNKYVVAKEPWALFKNHGGGEELDAVLYDLIQALAWISVLLSPVMPQISLAMSGQLDFSLQQAVGLGGQDLVRPGQRLPKPEPLFPRVDSVKVRAKAAKAADKAKSKPAEAAAEITIEEFARLDLRVGTILEAEAVAGADKLLRLLVDVGQDKPRTVVAGIARHYNPSELPGLQVVVVANLKPVSLRGVESQGMILAASAADAVKVLIPAAPVPAGSKVK
jgi:methionyl-tRNA synthetase